MEDFYAELAAASLEDPRDFAESVLLLAQRHLDLVAGTFYLYTPEAQTIRLKAQVGFSTDGYQDFQLPPESFAGESIRARRAISDDHPANSHLFRDKELLEKSPVGGIVAAPLPLTHPPQQGMHRTIAYPDPIGAICLYPREQSTIPSLMDWATKYGPFLARLYLATLERYAMYFRGSTVEGAAFRGDIGSLAHAFLDLVSAELEVRSAGLWVYDHRRKHLYLKRATGSYANTSYRTVAPVAPDDTTVIGKCFVSGEPAFHSMTRKAFTRNNLPSDVRLPASNAAVFPIRLPQGARLGGRHSDAGVLALIDHQTEIDGTVHLTDFSWEDVFLANFGCEMLSVLLYQALRTRDYESDFERRMHGASTALQAARSNLQFLTTRSNLTERLPSSQRNYIPNAIDWIEDLEAQMSRDDVVMAKIKRKPIRLYGEVLAKVGPMVKRMATRDRAGKFTVLGLDELRDSYHQLPEVWGDRRALDLVFRNLIENSLKYQARGRSQSNELFVRTDTSNDGSRVFVFIEDNGLGIAPIDAPFLFEDGFRGGQAAGRKPQGIGRGLFECKAILTKLGGDIILVPPEKLSGAAFRIELETASVTRRKLAAER